MRHTIGQGAQRIIGAWLLAALAVATTEGCGSGGSSPAACDQSAVAYCAQLFMCSPEVAKDYYGTMEGCTNSDAASCRYLATVPGTSSKSIESWAACDHALAALSCEQSRFSGELEACRFPAGTRKIGEACRYGEQCASTFCRFAKRATGQTDPCGVCSAAPTAGQACDDTNMCGFGLACVFTSTSTGKCAVEVTEGAACDGTTKTCAGDLICPDGHCVRPGLAGADCTGNVLCDGNLVCLSGACTNPLDAGAACKPEDLSCAADLGCLNGTCTALQPGGANCTSDAQCLTTCDGPLAPDGSVQNGTCHSDTLTVEVGDTCGPALTAADTDRTCRFSAFCDPTSNTCVLRRVQGGACTDDSQCQGLLVCAGGACGLPPALMCSTG